MTIEEAIKQRHSVRKYIHKPLSTEVVRALEEKIGECNKEGGLHIQLVTQETKAFSFSSTTYGIFKAAVPGRSEYGNTWSCVTGRLFRNS